MAITKDTRVFAASIGYRDCDAMGTYVSLIEKKALQAAEEACEKEIESSKDSCCQYDEEGHNESDCPFCSPSLWQNGEHAHSLGDLMDEREIREHRDALIAGDVVGLGGC